LVFIFCLREQGHPVNQHGIKGHDVQMTLHATVKCASGSASPSRGLARMARPPRTGWGRPWPANSAGATEGQQASVSGAFLPDTIDTICTDQNSLPVFVIREGEDSQGALLSRLGVAHSRKRRSIGACHQPAALVRRKIEKLLVAACCGCLHDPIHRFKKSSGRKSSVFLVPC
jgi:hypothetical protein